MRGLAHIKKVIVPASCVEEAHSHLRRVGHEGYEGFALWAGESEGDTFLVRANIIPEQRGLRSDLGVCVVVGGDELHRINVWLYEHGLTLIAQLHSHPDEAYHSETDDTYPIATTTGSLSLVIPDFARDPFSLANCAVYRLLPPSGWVELSQDGASSLIVLEEQAGYGSR
jgi:Prokaryotic homologs of the JAB domain